MDADFRDHPHFLGTQELLRKLRASGSGHISDAADPDVSPDGRLIAFAGMLEEAIDDDAPGRICVVEVATGRLRVASAGPHDDRMPKFSPDGRWVAFISDRASRGNAQLQLLDLESGQETEAVKLDGWVEHIQWSPDSSRILMVVARPGADTASTQIAKAGAASEQGRPAWLPEVHRGGADNQWRDAWIYDLRSGEAGRIQTAGYNIWECCWCGMEAIVTIASEQPGEGHWYRANVYLVALAGGDMSLLYEPEGQVAQPCAFSSGDRVAFIEGVASDRGVLVGDLRLVSLPQRRVRRLDVGQLDISSIQWRAGQSLLVSGHRRLETVVGNLNLQNGVFKELWAGSLVAGSGRYAKAAALPGADDFAIIVEGFANAPEIAIFEAGSCRTLHSVDAGLLDVSTYVHSVRPVCWTAGDGVEIDGFLVSPPGEQPFATIMLVHGGPISHWRSHWMGRRGATELALLGAGYALFFPNPRGSSGRGMDFARQVLGDLGGMDAEDLKSGLDALVSAGIVDGGRLGVMGGSYGGFMAAWLVTQTDRFAAAVAVAPVTNWVSELFMSNIPQFTITALQASFRENPGPYYSRSPISYAHRAVTPTLSICGALDRCTPPAEAVQFHNALLQAGVDSALLVYPQEGHGVRKAPAAVDYTARILDWFERHMPANI